MILPYLNTLRNKLFLTSKLKSIKAIFWDLDGTLWQDQAMAEHIYTLYVSYFSNITKKPPEEAKEILFEFEKQGSDWAETISSFSKIPRIEVLIELDKKITRDYFIQKDENIESLLQGTKQSGIRNFVASNMLSKNGLSGLQKLGIKNPEKVFDDCFFLDTIDLAKPDSLFFSKIIEKTRVVPQEALFVGDSYSNDIAPARSTGLKTCLIRETKGSADLKYIKVQTLLHEVLLYLDREAVIA